MAWTSTTDDIAARLAGVNARRRAAGRYTFTAGMAEPELAGHERLIAGSPCGDDPWDAQGVDGQAIGPGQRVLYALAEEQGYDGFFTEVVRRGGELVLEAITARSNAMSAERVGQACTVVEQLAPGEPDRPLCGVYVVRFDDGVRAECRGWQLGVV